METDTFLNDVWCLYFHDQNDNSWTASSYQLLATMSSIQDFAKVAFTMRDHWSKGMFFIMREHIQPMWEDPNNKNGGCFSMKVLKNHIGKTWIHTCALALGENLTKTGEEPSNITGISISPKKNFCIVRIWIADVKKNDQNMYHLNHPDYTEIFFKAH